jgi:hypothetical protein
MAARELIRKLMAGLPLRKLMAGLPRALLCKFGGSQVLRSKACDSLGLLRSRYVCAPLQTLMPAQQLVLP